MAPEADANAGNVRRGDGPRGRGRSRGRGRGRGDSMSGGHSIGQQRGGRGGARDGQTQLLTQSSHHPDVVDEGQRQKLAAAGKAKTDGDGEGEEGDVEAEVCFICASEVVHNAVAPCNHRTCHICALRMRALYKTKDCAHCRVSHSLLC